VIDNVTPRYLSGKETTTLGKIEVAMATCCSEHLISAIYDLDGLQASPLISAIYDLDGLQASPDAQAKTEKMSLMTQISCSFGRTKTMRSSA
jgi:hypothetical protein